MKEKIYDLLKGILIGIASLMPGFSGGVMAVAFNVYDRIINAINNFLKMPIKVIKDVWTLGVGIVLGALLSLTIISLLLEYFPVPTIFFLTGLIVGSIPNIYEKVKPIRFNYKKILSFFLGFLFIISLLILSIFVKDTGVDKEILVDLKQVIVLFFVGIIASATLIIPGVSGTLVLLAIGYYQYLVKLIMGFLEKVMKLNFTTLLPDIILIFSFGIGLVFGLLILAKAIEGLIEKFPKTFYSIVLGLLFASPFAIIYQLYIDYKEIIHNALIYSWIFGIIFLIIGVIVSIYINKNEDELEKRKV